MHLSFRKIKFGCPNLFGLFVKMMVTLKGHLNARVILMLLCMIPNLQIERKYCLRELS